MGGSYQAIAGGRTTTPPVADVPTLRDRTVAGAGRPAKHARRRPATLRGDIQGMRALAILLVLLNHAGIGGLTGGYVGVDVFFVVSGFLITGLLVREIRRTGRVSIADFYARRARRILPAATVVLLAVVAVTGLVFTYARVDDVLTHVGWAAASGEHPLRAVRLGLLRAGRVVSPVQHSGRSRWRSSSTCCGRR